MAAIHQFVPMLEPSAVGNHVLAARDVLRGAGFESEIFAGVLHPACAGAGARDAADYGAAVRGGARDVTVYHLAIGSALADGLPRHGERLVVDYHNLTPMRYLAGWDPFAADAVAWGRRQLVSLASRASLGLGDSHFNAAELDAAGYRPTRVAPILLPPSTFAVEPDAGVRAELRARKANGGADWLFVGSLAPHKAQHDIVKAFAVYRRCHDPHARCSLVGGGSAVYAAALREYVDRLGLADAVTITGPVSEPAKQAYYATADVFVACSEHEGFLVPLLEAMSHHVPIVAYAAAAVPETLGDAGVLLDRKDPFTVAAAVDRVVRDVRLRDALDAAAQARLDRFSLARTSVEWLDALAGLARG